MKAMESNAATAADLVAAGRRRRARRAYTILALVAGAIAGVYFVHRWWTRGSVSTDDAQIDADVVPVVARVAGPVQALRVQDNAPVKAGDVLVELDPTDFEARLHQSEADLEAARAQADAADAQVRIVSSSSTGGLSTARAQLSGAGVAVRGADAEVSAAEASLARAQSSLTKASSDFARAEQLLARQAITAPDFEAAKTTRDMAQAAVDQARAQLSAAREQRHQASSRVAEAQGRVAQSAVDAQIAAAEAAARLAHARVKASEAAVEQARLSLSYTRVVAPTDGMVSRLGIRTGQVAQAGQLLLMVVPTRSYVVANFKETEVGPIRPGDHADVEVDAYPGRTFHGVVEGVSAATGARLSLLPPDNATGNFVKVVQRVPVKIAWQDAPADVMLRAGLSAEVTIHVR